MLQLWYVNLIGGSFLLSFHPKLNIMVKWLNLVFFFVGGGQGGGRPGEKGAGGVREAGEEGAGSGIPKVAESGRKQEKLCNIAQYFAIEKCKGAGAEKYRAGTGIKGYGKREV